MFYERWHKLLYTSNRYLPKKICNQICIAYNSVDLGRIFINNILPIDKISPNICRQVVARTILETLRVVTDDPDDVNSVLNVMTKLADDVGKGIYFDYTKQSITACVSA